jgi:Domain of unknown function (DUF5666)
MEDDREAGWKPATEWPPPRRRGRRWLLIGGLALAFALTLGVGAIVGSTIRSTQAAGIAFGGANGVQTLSQAAPFDRGAQPGPQGQCGMLTVSSVSGQTILAKEPDGSTVTVHTTASTQYTRAGQSVAASAVKSGAQIRVHGTHNSDGSITATSIDVVG